MNNNIIPENQAKETKIYKANFDKYSSPDGVNVFFDLINIRDDKGNLVKNHCSINALAAIHLIGKLLPNQEVAFSAEVIIGEDFPDRFNFIKVTSLEID